MPPSSFQPDSEQHLPWRVTLTVMAVTLLSVALILIMGWSAMTTVDRSALDRESSFAMHGLADGFARIPIEQESAVVWDEAVERVRAHDQAWMRSNLGEWMGSYFGHNRVLVLDPENVPIHAMTDGATVAPDLAYHNLREVVAPLVVELRQAIGVVASGPDDPTEENIDVGVADFVLLGGYPAIISVKPIIPDTDEVEQQRGTEYLHVAIRFLDDTFVGQIAADYQLSDLRVLEPGTVLAEPSVPVVSRSGKTVAHLAWTPYRPGLSMVEKLAPIFAIAAIPIALLVIWLARSLWQSTERLRFLAFHDPLTGLPNRALFNIRLRAALDDAKSSGGAVAVMMIDLDRFKNINDTLGHPAGDALIRQMGERLRQVIGAAGFLARLGGDEFAVVLHHSVEDESEPVSVADRILLETRRPFVLDGEQVVSSVSIGIANASRGSKDTSDLLRRADIALYEAKSKGRERRQVFFPELSDIVMRRRAVEQELRLALENGSITTAYQAVFDTGSRAVVGAEGLLRWQHEVHGALAPEILISIAEERGLIEPIGNLVLQSACHLLKATSLPWVALNLSPVQLRNEGFAEGVLEMLQRFGLEPRRLQFEVKESILMADDAETVTNLHTLRSAGAKVALDDFGTGYSSLNHLRTYPVDKVKIDRSLVNQLPHSAECQAITQAIVSLAKSLHKVVAAEGVATLEEQELVVALGCDELQGFALSKPLSLIQFRSQFGDRFDDGYERSASK